MAPDASQTPDGIVIQIMSSNNLGALNHTLRNFLAREVRETVFASSLGNGQDPLAVLDLRAHTLGILYIISARLHSSTSPAPSWQILTDFCRVFDPEQARYAPDRVTMLAKGIVRLAEGLNSPKSAIRPLQDLVTRYPPSPSYLTTIHPIFLQSCVSTHHFSAALPLLSHPITTIDISLSDLTYNDSLLYHYTGGIALAALKQWGPAEEYFEICVTSPGQVPAALQMEALKKLMLVQLIAKGKATSSIKYAHQILTRLLKNTVYNTFANAYPRKIDQLRAIVEKERQLFINERNLGLVQQALDRAPRWAIKTLTATYLTLGLSDIGLAVGIESEDAVRALILSMIESSEISAQISADGTVTFSDPPPQFTKTDVDRVLREAQEQGAMLVRLEMEIARSREYLTKAVKTREDPSWGPMADEDAYGTAPTSSWTEETVFS